MPFGERASRVLAECSRDTHLTDLLARLSLPELVPELDWSVIEPLSAERQALLRIADHLGHEQINAPALTAELRTRAEAIEVPALPSPNGRRLLMTMFGWNDSGGGTILPRLVAKELVRRGWEVSVFHAATAQLPGEPAYASREWTEDGVRLVGIHNRPSVLFDMGAPEREIDDPAIREAFRQELHAFQPQVVHFHNLHNLGASLIDEVAGYGIPSYLTTHNYWLICPRAYLMHGTGIMCEGPGDGTRCAACTGGYATGSYARRLSEVRNRVLTGVSRVLAISDSVRRTLVATGYDAEAIDVVRQAMPHQHEIWERVGRDRPPGRRGRELTVAFLGSAYPHKGPQLLIEAAQRTKARVKVKVIGEVPGQFAATLRKLDRRKAVEISGSYSPSELPGLLAEADVAALPSIWWDCANLAAEECHAARLPLLVPRLGGLAETVRDGVDGLTSLGLDVDGLAAGLDRLASEDGLLERLQAGIEPPARFSEHVDQLESYYRAGPPTAKPLEITPAGTEVRWKGDHGLPTSLSIINDEISSRLPGPVQRVERNGRNLDPPLSRAADVEVHHEWPPDLEQPPAGRFATIIPWEFGSVPKEWLTRLKRGADELWVPSEYTRRMYVTDGMPDDRVHVIPNGVDLDMFSPAAQREPSRGDPVRFLYVGGFNNRKGPDLLLHAFELAFAGRDDVELVMKTTTGGGAYGGPHKLVRERAAPDLLPRLELIEDDLDPGELVRLYRSCHVFVLPYRGEGFAMPVLEAMACGLPVIVTAGGPTDEFCPPEAGWRIRASPKDVPPEDLEDLEMVHQPWMLEPEFDHLIELLQAAASAGPAELAAKGQAGRAAAERYSWDAVAEMYTARIAALATRPSRRVDQFDDPFPFEEDVELRVLATPAWRGSDRLTELLQDWARATTSETPACLYLLADPLVAGTSEEIGAFVVDAAQRSGVELDTCADVNVLIEPSRADRDARLHQSVDAYVPLHAGCAGHRRLAQRAGSMVIEPGSAGLAQLIGTLGGDRPGTNASTVR